MTQKPEYEVRFQPGRGSWLLSGPIGANGGLFFKSAREAVSYARWAAKADGGMIAVYNPQGKFFKTIEISPNLSSEDGFVLPSCDDLGDRA